MDRKYGLGSILQILFFQTYALTKIRYCSFEKTDNKWGGGGAGGRGVLFKSCFTILTWSQSPFFHPLKIPKKKSLASSCGLVVKAEDSWPRGLGFKPPLWRPFFRHHSFGSKLGTKIVENSNLTLLHML